MIQFPFDVFVVVSDLESVGILSFSEMYFTTGLTWNWEQRRGTPLATWSRQKQLVSPWLQSVAYLLCKRSIFHLCFFGVFIYDFHIRSCSYTIYNNKSTHPKKVQEYTKLTNFYVDMFYSIICKIILTWLRTPLTTSKCKVFRHSNGQWFHRSVRYICQSFPLSFKLI